MIAGRNPALWLGAVVALINALVFLNIVALDPKQVEGLDILAAALIGLLANESDLNATNVFPH